MYVDISEIKPSNEGTYKVKIVNSDVDQQREAKAKYKDGTFEVELHGDEFVKYWFKEE